MSNQEVAIVMGSDSDWPVMQEAATVLEECGISFNVDVISAHRTPDEMLEFAHGAAKAGYKVIIAGAGGAAHLPGMIAASASGVTRFVAPGPEVAIQTPTRPVTWA